MKHVKFKTAEIKTPIRHYVLYKFFKEYGGVMIPVSVDAVPIFGIDSLSVPSCDLFFIPKINIDAMVDSPAIYLKEMNYDIDTELKNDNCGINKNFLSILECLWRLQIGVYKGISYEKEKQICVYVISYINTKDGNKTLKMDVNTHPIYAIHDKRIARKVIKNLRKNFGFRNFFITKLKIDEIDLKEKEDQQ